jgi:5-methyltetrahydropteroyltriglutamate--homocysteine methyltransferase
MNSHILGFPRIGAMRELKFALEAFWSGQQSLTHLESVAHTIRHTNWQAQKDAGLSFITVGDFAYYDQMLNHTQLFGVTPERFSSIDNTLAQYFAMARGTDKAHAMEMTKWFDTNYHYLVPELNANTHFSLDHNASLFAQIDEAKALNHPIKVALIGPLTYLFLSKSKAEGFDRLTLIHDLVYAYSQLLVKLKAKGIDWVQIDEPALVLDLPTEWKQAYQAAYFTLNQTGVKLLLTTYFGGLNDNFRTAIELPVAGVHLDVTRGSISEATQAADWLTGNKILSVGIVDGRNIWVNDLEQSLAQLRPLREKLGNRLWVSASCSLQHVPVSLAPEHNLPKEVKSWFAFAQEKLTEIRTLQVALTSGDEAVADVLSDNAARIRSRRLSPHTTHPAVRERLKQCDVLGIDQRHSAFEQRKRLQQSRFNLPLLPTTTIGSFPQTPEIRAARYAFKNGKISATEYETAMKAEIQQVVREQEALGIDVLVHGEPERNDMVEYFGEQLDGYCFSQFGWVQSYGSRCVKPPIIFGDVTRPNPITVAWSAYAQTLTKKPMKGMLSGPITMLQWAFVRDDQSRELTAMQIAFALRDEVSDLANAGIGIIQIDEPAIREGLPLRKKDWASYLAWATKAFRITASGVEDWVQIHTHMCYSEFNDILPEIASMDADVITIETSRSDMELLRGFGEFAYPNDIGPGVYDIHSPRVPPVSEMLNLLNKALAVFPLDKLWVNPDCGLKTRKWPETRAALANMVAATQQLRKHYTDNTDGATPNCQRHD